MRGSAAFVLAAEDRQTRRFDRFLRRFGRASDRQMVCGLTDSQFQALDLLYDTSLAELTVGGAQVPVATVTGHNLHTGDLRRILRSSSDGPLHCRLLQFKRVFYLLFNPSIS